MIAAHFITTNGAQLLKQMLEIDALTGTTSASASTARRHTHMAARCGRWQECHITASSIRIAAIEQHNICGIAAGATTTAAAAATSATTATTNALLRMR